MDIPAQEFQKLQDRLDVVLDHIRWDESISEIATERGISQPTIREWIKRFDVIVGRVSKGELFRFFAGDDPRLPVRWNRAGEIESEE